MGGFFGTVSQVSCVTDLFYGTDYNSHLGTKRGGLTTYSEERGFIRSIHNLESTYFRTKFEDELDKFKGNAGIGIISRPAREAAGRANARLRRKARSVLSRRTRRCR